MTFQLTLGSALLELLNSAGRTSETPDASTAAPVIITKNENERSYSHAMQKCPEPAGAMRLRVRPPSLQRRAGDVKSRYGPSFPCQKHTSQYMRLDTGQLTLLRRAIANNDVDKAQQQLQSIIASGTPDVLSTHDLRDVSQLLRNDRAQSCASPQAVTSEVALFLAARGHTDALESCMYSHLRSNTPELAGLLWKRLQQTLTARTVAQSKNRNNTPRNITYLKSLERPLALVITCLATCRERESALRAGLGVFADIPMRADHVERVAPVPDQGHVLPVIRQYVEEIRVARLLERPRGALLFIDAACERGDLDALLQFFRAIVNGIEAGWIAPKESIDQSTAVIMMTELIWSTLISGFVRLSRLEAAQAVWARMSSLGVVKTATSWNAFLDGHRQHGRYDELIQAWSKMNESNVSPNLASYTTMISALFQAKRSEDALRLWNEAQTKIAHEELHPRGNIIERQAQSNENPSGDVKSLVVLHNCVLHGLLLSAKPDEALALLEKMRCSGPYPDVTTLNTFIRHYSRKGNVSAIARFLRLLEELRIRPDVFTFTSVLHACLQSGIAAPDAVRRVQAAMEAVRVTPNVVMYCAIIDQTVRHGGKDNIDAGFEWLRAMERRGLKANEVTYTALLTALQRDQSLSKEYLHDKVDEITQKMDKIGSRKNRVTFNVLIKASLLNPGSVGLTNAIEYYRQMVASGIKANNDTWYILLHGALLRGSFGAAQQLLAEMSESGFVARGALEGVVRRVRAGK